MPLIDTNQLQTTERLPGWKGRAFSTEMMTFAHYDFAAGSTIHEHCHLNEEVWTVLEGELEVTIGGDFVHAGPGAVAVVPPNTAHSVRAITDGKAIVADAPVRLDMSGGSRGVVRIDFDSPVSLEADPTGWIEIPYTVHNCGKGELAVKRIAVETGASSSLPPPVATQIPEENIPSYCTLEPDQRHLENTLHPGLSSNQRTQIAMGESIFYVKGAVFYDDPSGAQHTTFCRIYDQNAFGGKGGFVDPKKPGYNYGS